MQNTSYFTFTIKWQNTKIHYHISRNFHEIDCGGHPPPQKLTKLFFGLLKPTIEKGASSFVSGGLFGPSEEPPLRIKESI